MLLFVQTESKESFPRARPPVFLETGSAMSMAAYAKPSNWSASIGKRCFDMTVAFVGLIVSLPIMLLASLGVLTSPGPLFFASIRIGAAGKRIRVLKFRTMRHREHLGLQLTYGEDDRITWAGRFLRKWKLDELPQLMNVLRGDMSMVGPRPDSPEFISALPDSAQCVLFSVKPGITSMASLQFRDEAAILGRVPHSELITYYVNTLLPHKVSLDLDYASRATFLSDLKILLQTVSAVLR